MMQDVGTAPLLMAAWIVAGLLTLAGALSYAELCTLMPRAGGEYVFLREAFGRPAGAVMSVAFAISALATLHCTLLSNPRIFYAMARDGLFLRVLGNLDRQTNAPRAAVIAYSGWAAVLTLLGGFDRLSNMAVFSFYVFYCANVVALIYLRRKRRDADRPFVVPGYPWVPLVFLLASLSVLVAIVLRGAPEVIWALVLLTLGLPAYLVFRGIYRPAVVGPPAAA